MQTDLERAVTALGQTGFDPLVGRKRFGLARAAGQTSLAGQAESYCLFAGAIDEPNLGL